MTDPRVFLLSPANACGERARMLLNPAADFDLARRLRSDSVPIGDLFAFISGLYFRGKLTYAARFERPPLHIPGTLVIAAGLGLVPPETPVSAAQFIEIASIPVDPGEIRYHEPLKRDAARLASEMPSDVPVILLGSIATQKYVSPLLEIFCGRLLFPAEFAGRGDMSRGGLLLRCARAGEELAYVPIVSAARRGTRPPRLPPLR